jgi:hypothetical protein
MASALTEFTERLGDLSLRTFSVRKFASYSQYSDYKDTDLLGAIRCVLLNQQQSCEDDLPLEVIERTGKTRIGVIVTIKDQDGVTDTFVVSDSETHWFVTEIAGALVAAPRGELTGFVTAKYIT